MCLLSIISQKADQGREADDEKKTKLSKGAEKGYLPKRSVTITCPCPVELRLQIICG